MSQVGERLRSKRGNTFLSVLISIGVTAMCLLFINQLVINSVRNSKSVDVYSSLDIIRSQLQSLSTRDAEAWNATVGDPQNTSLSCLASGVPCCVPGSNPCVPMSGPFRLLDRFGKIYYDSMTNPKAGFDYIGNVCGSFDSVNGNNECPFRATLSWRAVCKDKCLSPQVFLSYKIDYKPGSGALTPVLNSRKTNLDIYRDQVVSSSSMSFTQSKVYDTSGTFIVPTNAAFIMVEAWGGGGAGGWGNAVQGSPTYAVAGDSTSEKISPYTMYTLAGGGGGGGEYIKSIYVVSPGATYNVYVGDGGNPLATTAAGRSGKDSFVDVDGYIRARGGGDGKDCFEIDCPGTQGTGGLGGTGVTNFGVISLPGQDGGKYNETFSQWFHEEATAGAGNEHWELIFSGGNGGSSGGRGGRGASNDRDNGGSPSTAPGGGGAGMSGAKPASISTPPAVAVGAPGRIIIWW